MKQYLGTFFLIFCLFSMNGCSKSVELATLSVDIQGDENMNNKGRTAIVRIYQLTNETKFANANFEAFWSDDEALLLEELVPGTKQQLRLRANKPETREIQVANETKYIGFAANLYAPDGSRWRQLYAVELLEKSRVVVSVKENYLAVDFN